MPTGVLRCFARLPVSAKCIAIANSGFSGAAVMSTTGCFGDGGGEGRCNGRRITVDLGFAGIALEVRLLFRPRRLPDNRVRFQASHYPVVAGPVAQPSKAIRPLSESSQAAHQPRSHDFEFSACHTLQERIEHRPLLAALGAVDTFIAIGRTHHGPAKPSTGLLERLRRSMRTDRRQISPRLR